MKTMIIVTFHNSDFAGENFNQLLCLLRQYAIEGTGCWFKKYTNFVQACLPFEDDYTWIMEHVANYGNININK